MTLLLRFFLRCSLFILVVCCACNNGEDRKLQRSFYYWKTVFQLSPKEDETLAEYSVSNLYVRFFDVDWNELNHSADPVAKAIFQQKLPPGIHITPVVFITQEPLQQSDNKELSRLATNINRLLTDMAANNSLALSGEVQIDCDWTATTKDKYFFLLEVRLV